jgi:hypothetical protein
LTTSGDFQPIEEPNTLKGLWFAIGYVAQNWAMMEQNFDMWVAMIYHDMFGRQKINKQIPRSFSYKIKFLRRSFNQLPPLRPFANEAIPLLMEALSLAQARNDLIHGVITTMEPVNEEWPMVIFDYSEDDQQVHWHKARKFSFRPRRFRDFESKLLPLVGKVCVFGHRLLPLVKQQG